MPPTPLRMMLTSDLGLRQLGDLVLERLQRAGDVGLEDEVELLELALLDALEEVVEGDLAARAPRLRLVLDADRALVGLARATLSFSTTRTYSPASGTPSKPSTSTGSPGSASSMRSPT